MSINFLEKIRPNVERRVLSMPEMHIERPNLFDFCDVFRASHKPVIISEIKFSSPSRGQIYKGKLDHVGVASEYLASGASALSVLVEPDYFKGSIDFIKDIRAEYPKSHILLKDFILSKKQIKQGLIYGANAVLLIAAFLEDVLLKELYDYSLMLGITPIVEVHNIQELERVLRFSPSVIGINNRNLQTLETSLEISRQLVKYIPDNCYTICESGIDSASQIHEMIDIGFDGFLIGSSFMNHENPGIKLQQLIYEVQNES